MHETDCACGHEPFRGACPRLTYISLAVGEMALRETGERGLAANFRPPQYLWRLASEELHDVALQYQSTTT
jgi:hypothetical protein